MDSYQEVAYNISNSNRGYIFLISSAKFIFLAITASFAIDYCASYLAQLCLMRMYAKGDTPTSGAVYAFYLMWVIVIGGFMFFPYHRLRNDQQNGQSFGNLKYYARIFTVCFICFELVFFVTMAFAAGRTSSISGAKDEQENNPFLWQQLMKNGGLTPSKPKPDPVDAVVNLSDESLFEYDERRLLEGVDDQPSCSDNQAIIGYIPALFYSNMFSIYFLEIKSLTKL